MYLGIIRRQEDPRPEDRLVDISVLKSEPYLLEFTALGKPDEHLCRPREKRGHSGFHFDHHRLTFQRAIRYGDVSKGAVSNPVNQNQ